MKPEIDEAAGQVVMHLQLQPGNALDELVEAAEHADSITDLPGWAQAGLVSLAREAEQERAAEPAAPDPGPGVDTAELDDETRLWTEAAERHMIPPGSFNITPPTNPQP